MWVPEDWAEPPDWDAHKPLRYEVPPMSAVIAEGRDGEPGGLDATETVLHGQVNGVTQAAQLRWAGRTCYLVLSLDGDPDVDGWDLPYLVGLSRRAGGH